MTWTITIPDWHPTSLNTHLAKGARRAGLDLHREKKRVANHAWAIMRRDHIPPAEGKRLVTITICKDSRGKVEDALNLTFRSKAILDALSQPKGNKRIGVGLIVDDSPEWVEARVVEEFGGVKETRIELEDIE